MPLTATLHLGAAWIVLGAGCSLLSLEHGPPDGYSRHTSGSLGLTIDYPDSWRVRDTADGLALQRAIWGEGEHPIDLGLIELRGLDVVADVGDAQVGDWVRAAFPEHFAEGSYEETDGRLHVRQDGRLWESQFQGVAAYASVREMRRRFYLLADRSIVVTAEVDEAPNIGDELLDETAEILSRITFEVAP